MSASKPTITPLGDGRVLVDEGTRRRLAYAAAEPNGTWIFLDGEVFLVEAEGGGRRRAKGGDDQAALASPMPATVVLVNVAAGQQVAAGDLLIMLEAMKMELPIKSPRAARVKSIACRQGELVQPGVPLLALE